MNVPTIICPKCNTKLELAVDDVSKLNPSSDGNIPLVRSKIKPVGLIHSYRITSDQIADFLRQKAAFYQAGAKVELGVAFCEKKNSDPHRSYAVMKIALSEDVVEKTQGNSANGWYEKIGESGINIRFTKNIYHSMVKRYRFLMDDLNAWSKNYRTMEKLENRFGINEVFLDDIRRYVMPRRMPTNDGTGAWVIFAARAEKIIEDMLENPDTGKVDGRLEIYDIVRLDNERVEFSVYVHTNETVSYENPYVRQILMGGDKKN